MKFENKTTQATNIREIRELLGFTQEEFAYLIGISAVYLSQLETGSRPLNNPTSEKIAKGLNWLTANSNLKKIKPRFSNIFPFDAATIRANHIASFQPRNIQEKTLKLMHEKHIVDMQLTLILEMGIVKAATDLEKEKSQTPTSLMGRLRKILTISKQEDPFDSGKIIEKNIALVKELHSKRKSAGASYKKKKSLMDDLNQE